jgi:5-amino-6-(5-phosphoribosylamino)uracil reductase
MQFTRLLPEPGTVELETLRDGLEFPAHHDRPHTVANFVSTADGRAAVHGRSAPLSSPGDRAMFHALRERVDAIIAGVGTLRTERYGRMIRDADARQRRVDRGLSPEPLACVVTRSGELPLDIPLFEDDEAASRVVVFTTPEAKTPPKLDTVRIHPTELTLMTVLGRLSLDYGIRSLLCEGGPTLFGALLHEQLIDELFLTISPHLAGGGTAPTIASGAEFTNPESLRLAWALGCEGSLFLRYAVSPQAA